MTIIVKRTDEGRTYSLGENTIEAARQAGIATAQRALAEIAASALEDMTLTVERSAATIDIYTAELLPLANRYIRSRMERVVDAANRYDVWQFTGAFLVQRVGGAFVDIVQIASASAPISALETGKSLRMGAGREHENTFAGFLADGRRLGPAETGTFKCRTFSVLQKGEVYEAEAAVPRTTRFFTRSARTFSSFGSRYEFGLEFSDDWSLAGLDVGDITVLGGAGATFDKVLTGPSWDDDTFPPAIADRTDALSFRFYGPLGVMLQVAMEGTLLSGHRTNIDGTGKLSLVWKDQPYAAATTIGTQVTGQIDYDFAWRGQLAGVDAEGWISPFGRSLLDDVDAAAARDTLGISGLLTTGGVLGSAGAFSIGGGVFSAPLLGKALLFSTNADGLVLTGRGSSTDLVLTNKTGNTVADVPTGTVDMRFYGNVTLTGAGVFQNAAFANPAAGTGRVIGQNVSGLVMAGRGTTSDITVANKNGTTIFDVATGTVVVNFYGSINATQGVLLTNTAFVSPAAGTARLTSQTADGLVMAGNGSSNDCLFVNASGSNVFAIPHGTTTFVLYGKIKHNTLPGDFANDAAAATGGVAIGEVYRNGSVLMVRVA